MSDKSSFSERMRAHADRTWRAILRHRFFREVATDAINDRVFARYLRIEYGFVDTAARALGYAVAKAPSFQERRRLGLGLYGLVTDQEQVFVDAFERMGAPDNERTGLAPQGLALPLHALFLKVAETEGYEEILACTLAAEWMYLTWCSTANQSPSSRSVHSRLGRSSRRRRLCRACRVGPLGNRHKRTDAHRSPASAAERALRRGLGGGNRFPRRGLRWVIVLGAMGPRVLSEPRGPRGVRRTPFYRRADRPLDEKSTISCAGRPVEDGIDNFSDSTARSAVLLFQKSSRLSLRLAARRRWLAQEKRNEW